MNDALSHKLTLLPLQPKQSSDNPAPLQAPEFPEFQNIDALYLHVPFCFHKCHYCDFYSLVEPENRDRQEAFTHRLIRELNHRSKQLHIKPETLFVGGGTPTLLREPYWQQILETLDALAITPGLREFTVEANPETVTPELARTLVAGGVGRVSMGAQSFQPELLKALERWHDPASVPRAVDILRSAGVKQINIDLIFAIPGQTMAMLEADINAALALQPDHLSCYGLTYEPQTALTQRLKMGQVTPADESLEKQMYEYLLDRLDAEGFEHYEVSNWARRSPDGPRVCHHNMAYWFNRNWLGCGPGAGSHVAGYRWKNLPNLGKYLANEPEPPVQDVEGPDEDRQLGEALMLGLRLRQGVTLDWYQSAVAPKDSRRQVIEDMLHYGMMEQTTTHLRLTRQGLLVADYIIGKLL